MCRKFILFFGCMLYTSLDMLIVEVEETATCRKYCKAVHDATCVGFIMSSGDQMLFFHNHIFVS
jgi:hypothetical protein